MARLGDVVLPVLSRAPTVNDSPFRYVDLSTVDAGSKTLGESKVLDWADAPSRARQRLKSGDVLVSTVRPNLNGVAVVSDDLDGAIGSTGFCVLRVDPTKLDNRFLFHWVRSDFFVGSMTRLATGASYPAVSDAIVKASDIPLPPLPEQRRIAAILDRVSSIRTQRQTVQHIAIPIADSKPATASRATTELRDLAVLVTKGTTPTSVGLKFSASGVPFVRAQNIHRGRVIFDSESLFIPHEAHQTLSRSRIVPGDILVTIAGTIGRAGIVARDAPEMNCNQAVAIVRLRDPSHREYVLDWLNSQDGQSQIRSGSVTATITNFSLAQLGSLKIADPTAIDLRALTSRIERRRDLENKQGAHVAKLDELFASLQHRAFRGEL